MFFSIASWNWSVCPLGYLPFHILHYTISNLHLPSMGLYSQAITPFHAHISKEHVVEIQRYKFFI